MQKDDVIYKQAAIQTALEFIIEQLGGAFDEDFQKKLIERMSLLPSAQQWIPCSERLPEAGQVVLVYGKKGGIYTAIYNKPEPEWKCGWWKLNSKSHKCKPDAWMPLPKPYEVEK